jgi:hypothetical protein
MTMTNTTLPEAALLFLGCAKDSAVPERSRTRVRLVEKGSDHANDNSSLLRLRQGDAVRVRGSSVYGERWNFPPSRRGKGLT